MGKVGIKEIQDKAIEVLNERPESMSFREIFDRLADELEGANENTIRRQISTLPSTRLDEVYKPARGIYRSKKFRDADAPIEEPKKTTEEYKTSEKDLYESFAKWLTDEIEDCTKAIPLGGSKFRDKWGTPDVIGVKEPQKSDIIKFETEVISAEIKIDRNALITAFGQACAYRLFSHRTYIVAPKESDSTDLSKLDSLCQMSGIGLVLFHRSENEKDRYSYEIRVRPVRHDPDSYYTNQYLKMVENELF